MKETNIKNAKTAVTITTVLTFFAAGFEVIMAFMGSKPGMNIFDIASFAMANPNVYCLILILVNIILLPSAILLYRQNGISLPSVDNFIVLAAVLGTTIEEIIAIEGEDSDSDEETMICPQILS